MGIIKTPEEIEGMRIAGKLAAETLKLVGEMIRPGITTDDINTFVHEDTLKKGGIPAPLGYTSTPGVPPFPKSVCTSVNNVVCHGIPGPYVLQDGDIINVDITTIFNGFHGDTSATFFVGQVSDDAQRLVEVTRKSLELGIAEVREGVSLGNIGAAIQTYVESQGFSVVRDFVGHGIGRGFHEPPMVKHYGFRGDGIKLRKGMIFTIEPMVNAGNWPVFIDADDRWTAYTRDGSLSAQFEHTVLVTKKGAEVLTRV